jgi:hypothetical protein
MSTAIIIDGGRNEMDEFVAVASALVLQWRVEVGVDWRSRKSHDITIRRPRQRDGERERERERGVVLRSMEKVGCDDQKEEG